MAIANDSRKTGAQTLAASVTAATSVTWTHTLGAALTNGILIVSAAQDASAGSTGVVWDDGATNAAMTQKGTVTQGTTRAELWYLKSPAVTGTKTIRVSWSGSHEGEGSSASYSGVDQATTFNAASPQTATGAASPTSLAITTTAGELAIDAMVQDLGTTGSAPTKGASQTYIAAGVNVNTTSIESGHSEQAASGATTTMTWTIASIGAWGQVGLSLLPASGTTAAVQQIAAHRPAPFKPSSSTLRGF